MYKEQKIAVVIPAYNEEQLIGKTLRSIPEYVDFIITVNDGSTDNTAALIEQHRKHDHRIYPIMNNPNLGLGRSIWKGYAKCDELGADVFVVMAGDGQMPVFELPKFLKICEDGCGLVIGNRFAENDPRDFGMPAIRYYGAKILSFMTYISTGQHIPDSQNGYTALTKETLQEINLDALANRWGIHNDIISRCSVAGIPITTVPQASKFLDDDGKRIKSKVWVLNIILPNLFVFARALNRRILSSIGIKRY